MFFVKNFDSKNILKDISEVFDVTFTRNLYEQKIAFFEILTTEFWRRRKILAISNLNGLNELNGSKSPRVYLSKKKKKKATRRISKLLLRIEEAGLAEVQTW